MAGGTAPHTTDTTEMYDGSSWTNVGRLPIVLAYFQLININNRILSFGKHIFRYLIYRYPIILFSGGLGSAPSYKNNILEFDINKLEWTQIGNMTYAAHSPAVSEVNFADFEPWCQKRSLKKNQPILPVPGKKGDDASQQTDN